MVSGIPGPTTRRRRRFSPTTSGTRSLGLARQPLHVDQGDRRGRLPGAAAARPRRTSRRGELLWRWVAPLLSGALLAVTGHPAGLGPEASAALPLHLPPSPMAQLAGARGVRDRRVQPGARNGPRRHRRGRHGAAALPRDRGRAARGDDRDLHRLPLRSGEGARPVAESAAAAPSARPGGAHRALPPCCRRQRSGTRRP